MTNQQQPGASDSESPGIASQDDNPDNTSEQATEVAHERAEDARAAGVDIDEDDIEEEQ
jgi:hypothetical protein